MNTMDEDPDWSEDDDFVPPPPPPPRIFLLQGNCILEVLRFLDTEGQLAFVSSCRNFQEACRLAILPEITADEHAQEPESTHHEEKSTESSFFRSYDIFTFRAPPGRLGIRLDNLDDRLGTAVTLVTEDSPLYGKIMKDDVIVAVNGVDVSEMNTSGILEVFQKDLTIERYITVIRPVALAESELSLNENQSQLRAHRDLRSPMSILTSQSLESFDFNNNDSESQVSLCDPPICGEKEHNDIPFDRQLNPVELKNLNNESSKAPEESPRKWWYPVHVERKDSEIPFDEQTAGYCETSDDESESYVSSLDSMSINEPRQTFMKKDEMDFLTQFADAALFGDTSKLFSDLVHEVIDSAKHAAKLVVTEKEKRDPIDDQGPIKIGDNYYTHREAIQKWKKARDKLADLSTEERMSPERLQRKLERAAMKAATLMASTKTIDLAARRTAHRMDKVELTDASAVEEGSYNMDDLIHRRQISDNQSGSRSEMKGASEDTHNDATILTLDKLVNRLSLFGDDDNMDHETESSNAVYKSFQNSRFLLLEDELKLELLALHNRRIRDMTEVSRSKHPTEEAKSDRNEMQQHPLKSGGGLRTHLGEPIQERNERELELIDMGRSCASSSTLSRIESIPSPELSIDSSKTELAGCGGNKIGSKSTSSEEQIAINLDRRRDKEKKSVGFESKRENTGVEKTASSERSRSRDSSTKDNNDAVSEECCDIRTDSAARESVVSDDYSDFLPQSIDSVPQLSSVTLKNEPRVKNHSSRSRPAPIAEDGSINTEDVGDAMMCGLLLRTCEGSESKSSGATSKTSLDSLIGSQYGTEVVYRIPPKNTTLTQKTVTARKPRTLTNHNMNITEPLNNRPTKPTQSESQKTNPKTRTLLKRGKANPSPMKSNSDTTRLSDSSKPRFITNIQSSVKKLIKPARSKKQAVPPIENHQTPISP